MVVNAGGLWWRKDLPIFAVMHSWRKSRSPKSIIVPFPIGAVDCPDRV